LVTLSRACPEFTEASKRLTKPKHLTTKLIPLVQGKVDLISLKKSKTEGSFNFQLPTSTQPHTKVIDTLWESHRNKTQKLTNKIPYNGNIPYQNPSSSKKHKPKEYNAIIRKIMKSQNN